MLGRHRHTPRRIMMRSRSSCSNRPANATSHFTTSGASSDQRRPLPRDCQIDAAAATDRRGQLMISVIFAASAYICASIHADAMIYGTASSVGKIACRRQRPPWSRPAPLAPPILSPGNTAHGVARQRCQQSRASARRHARRPKRRHTTGFGFSAMLVNDAA